METIAKIGQGYVIYPTGTYEKYNIYLIEQYKKLRNVEGLNQKEVEREIQELEELLNECTSNDLLKSLNVISWEENLIYHYDKINLAFKYINDVKFTELELLKDLKTFLRREKLNEINKVKD